MTCIDSARLWPRAYAHLPEERSGSLLAATLPGAMGAVNVVKADDAKLDLGVVHAVPEPSC